MSAYRVTWRIDVEADSPLDAVRQARDVQLDADAVGFESVEVGRIEEGEYVPEGYVLTFDPDPTNPSARPRAQIEEEDVCCGHCGSSDVRYLEDIGQYGRFRVRDGIALVDGSNLSTDDDGNDPRVWCVDCSGESELPEPFQWA